ncbi:MAG TPA: hypothetical protein VIZ21_05065, partial [Ignavibacteriaceae bacterium]
MNSLINNKSFIIRLAVLVLTCLSLFIFAEFKKNTDGEIEKFFIKTRGEISPDTNIILIHFSE